MGKKYQLQLSQILTCCCCHAQRNGLVELTTGINCVWDLLRHPDAFPQLLLSKTVGFLFPFHKYCIIGIYKNSHGVVNTHGCLQLNPVKAPMSSFKNFSHHTLITSDVHWVLYTVYCLAIDSHSLFAKVFFINFYINYHLMTKSKFYGKLWCMMSCCNLMFQILSVSSISLIPESHNFFIFLSQHSQLLININKYQCI